MRPSISKWVWHPFLVAAYPVLALLATNIDEIYPLEALRSLIIALILAILLLVGLHLILRDWHKAGLLASGFLILFFSYGQVYSLIKSRSLSGFIYGRHTLLLFVWGILALLLVWWIFHKLRRSIEATQFLNLIGVVLVVLPTYTIVSHQMRSLSYTGAQASETNQLSGVAPELRPDIYYIILDGYGRQDVLKALYGYDNSEFLSFLKARGFYIADQSRSNYMQTALSLASSLNMEYLDTLAERLGVRNKDRKPLANRIKKNQVVGFLRSMGYKVVAFDSGYEKTNLTKADYFWSPKQGNTQGTLFAAVNGYEGLLIDSTALRPFTDLYRSDSPLLARLNLNSEYRAHQERVHFTLEKLDDVAALDGSYFVFAHILVPHPPFVFGPHGEAITPDNTYVLADGDYYFGGIPDYVKHYRDQVVFIDREMETVIDRILKKSQTPPVIIIQGDHGPGAHLVWDSAEKSVLVERFGILNAYLFPGGDQGLLYPTITPVNTFRAVLDRYFQAGLPLLDDENYFSTWNQPYNFIRVTERIKPPG